MQSASPPVDGYGELARQVLLHPEWPPDTQPQPRSLAALFSKLDRGIELEWLADRGAVQRTLALTLSCPLETLRRQVEPNKTGLYPGGRLRFQDLPFAKPFDFREEPLPPGIPLEVTRPAQWGRSWWRAPSGSGRSLTGQWLAARGLATFVSARSWGDAVQHIPDAGPTFVELERGDGHEALESVLARDGICVAAPFLPRPAGPVAGAAAPPPWRLIESPSPAEVLAPLLVWVQARLPEDGAFDAAAAGAWLTPPVVDGALPSLGALLGAAGALDARGVREAAGQTLTELATQFVNERLAEASSKGSSEAQWLKRFGFEVIVKLAQGALTGCDDPWIIARSRDEWIALIPTEFQQSVDTDWVRWSLSRSGGQTTVQDLERALFNVPPGAYRIVRALIEAQLLRESGPDRSLLISPEFLKHAALAEAKTQLVAEASAFSWGEALLRPHAAPSILDALYRRLSSDDFGVVDGLLELDIQSDPALVIATEASLVCLGLRVLEGAEVPVEYLVGVWDEQLRALTALPGELPRPRLLSFEAGGGFCALADPAVWGLAALAVSELLGDTQGAAHAVLRPWRSRQVSPELVRLLDAIHAVVLRPEISELPWAAEAFSLVGRLYEMNEPALEGSGPPLVPHSLAGPAHVVRALLAGEIGTSLSSLGPHPLEMRALRAECELRRVAWPRMAQALWRAWHAQGCPEQSDALLGPSSPCRDSLWAHLPSDVLGSVWQRWHEHGDTWPFHCFGRLQWSAFVSLWSRRWLSGPCHIWQTAFRAMDLEWIESAAREGKLLNAPMAHCMPLLPTLWQRFPGWMTECLIERLAAGDADALYRLLSSAPRALDTELVRVLSEGLARRNIERPVMDQARHWLSARVAARGPAWRAAYAVLAELERRVARASRARGG